VEWWSYWWLIFPLMGVAGGTFRAWERGARRRHERRLEILHAKSELKIAQVQARGLPATAKTRPDLAAPARSESTESRLQRLFDSHDAVTQRWLEYELDVAKLIAYPAMSDGRQPLTAAFLRAKKHADALRPASVKAKVSKEQLAEYLDAVTDYEVAFDVAERDARRVRDSSFTADERKRLDTAKQLLTVAIDQAATPAERQLAYRRVREELDGLISISDEAIEVLETKVALELPAATNPAAASASPAAEPAPRPVPDPKTGPWPVPARGTTAPGRMVPRGPQP
jgi:hypothetical protein